jgi:hypothetical protein
MGNEQRRVEASQVAEAPVVNWDGGIEEPIDWGDDKWEEIDGCSPIREDFDWSRVRNGKILGWNESRDVSDSPEAVGNPQISTSYEEKK